jgi:hypothetical protein
VSAPATSLVETLVAWETRYWAASGDADFYREHLAETAVMVFPAPTGIVNRKAAIDAVAGSLPWERFELEEPEAFELDDDVGLLVYRARARRQDASPYVAYCSSVYVRRDGEWKLASHQQTPI